MKRKGHKRGCRCVICSPATRAKGLRAAKKARKNPASRKKGKRNPKPKPRALSTFDRHQLRIARDTLRMSDAGASIMGGPTKEEARQIIYRLTGKWPRDDDYEGPRMEPGSGLGGKKNPRAPLTRRVDRGLAPQVYDVTPRRSRAPELTREIAWAAATDAANQAMRQAGRSSWSRDDYALAVEVFNRLWRENPAGEITHYRYRGLSGGRVQRLGFGRSERVLEASRPRKRRR